MKPNDCIWYDRLKHEPNSYVQIWRPANKLLIACVVGRHVYTIEDDNSQKEFIEVNPFLDGQAQHLIPIELFSHWAYFPEDIYFDDE